MRRAGEPSPRGRAMNRTLSQPLPISACRSSLRSLFGWCLVVLAACNQDLHADDREVYDGGAPSWLQAVARLQVPGSRVLEGARQHYIEDCSATLVVGRKGARANTVITAWHCLEYYRDLSRPLTLQFSNGYSGEAYRVADGGSMDADWAILKLYRPIPPATVEALLPQQEPADPARSITMAGFSRDPGLGQGGTRLTYDRNCSILSQDARSGHTDCNAYKGASGGAVIQLNEDGAARLTGVISSGDSEKQSLHTGNYGKHDANRVTINQMANGELG